MPQRSKEYRDTACQDVAVQMQYEDDEFCQCFKNYKPPPPPGCEDLWELQFCRWWGWNWVRKREVDGPADKGAKKGLKELCNCLRFKKGTTEKSTLQNLYNTPSNSIVVHKKYSCGAEMKKNSCKNIEIEGNISQKNRKNNEDKNTNVESWIRAKDEFSSSDEYCCCKALSDKFGSNSEHSIEYIKISCCPCHCTDHSVPEKCDCTTQTSKEATNVNCMERGQSNANMCIPEKITEHKKKRICIICCCCTKHHVCKCKCKSGGKREKVNNRKADTIKSENIKGCIKSTNYTQKNYTKPLDRQDMPSILNMVYNYPLHNLLYYKNLSRLTMLPQNSTRLYNTRSDIMDKLQKIKFEEKFSSPITGETYNLTPLKIDTFGAKPTTLSEPIDVSADLIHLRRLENEIKRDHESRVMLDAVCDAILSNNRCHTISNTVLNNITSSIKEPEYHINGAKHDFPKFTRTGIDELKDLNILNNNCANSKYCSDHILNAFSNNKNPKVDNDTNNIIKSLMLNYNTSQYAPLKNLPVNNDENNRPNELVSNMNRTEISKSDIKIFDAYIPSAHAKKASYDLENFDMINTNINDIFKKIEEIILKSKVNDKEIQNVLNTIPKETHVLSSEKITCECNFEDFTSKNSLNEDTRFKTNINMFSDTLQQNDINRNTDMCKLKENIPNDILENEEKRILQPRKRKKHSKSSLSPVKKTDKFKTNRKK